MVALATKIHHTAIIENSVKIGKNVEVGPYSVISGNVIIQKLDHML
jgi:acyl-[acyl carrier protein]--UDP-N-acetylglucosamine O-acyltransferase